MLRTWQDIFGIKPYLAATVYANDMSEMFKTLQISALTSDASGVHLTATNLIASHTNYLLFASGPAGPWQTITTNVATSSGQTFTITPANPSGFYRLQELP
jgi:hypothetical protein